MHHEEQQYLNFLETILAHGELKNDRTGVGTQSIFDYTMHFNLENNRFPLLTTKKVYFKGVVCELLWFLKGDTNIQYLQQNQVKIWNEWADDNGDLGPVYGHQWRSWRGADGQVFDQIQNVIDGIKSNPHSRRHIVSAWNVAELDKMALPPCHAFFQFYVSQGGLSCKLTQRSADAFLGVPFNIASYSLLTIMIAQQCGLQPKEFIWSGGDCHIYQNHFDQVKLQLSRTPVSLPTLQVTQQADINSYRYDDFKLFDYHPQPAIQAEIAV